MFYEEDFQRDSSNVGEELLFILCKLLLYVQFYFEVSNVLSNYLFNEYISFYVKSSILNFNIILISF